MDGYFWEDNYLVIQWGELWHISREHEYFGMKPKAGFVPLRLMFICNNHGPGITGAPEHSCWDSCSQGNSHPLQDTSDRASNSRAVKLCCWYFSSAMQQLCHILFFNITESYNGLCWKGSLRSYGIILTNSITCVRV